MIVWGGFGSGSYLNSGGRYSPATDSWVATSLAGAPAERFLHTAIWDGNEMIVWGGVAATVLGMSDGGRFRPAANGWSPTTESSAVAARHDHTAVWTGREMIVFGGIGQVQLNDTRSYTPGQVMFLYQKP
jgi:hypothetical protein